VGSFKNLLLQNHSANLTRLGTDHPLVEGIQVCSTCSNEGNIPSPRGDNSKRVKIHRKFLKIFSRTSRPKLIKLNTNYPWVKGIQVCSNKGPGTIQSGDNHKNVKMGWVKNLILKNYEARKS
jgi:hypothetical protein